MLGWFFQWPSQTPNKYRPECPVLESEISRAYREKGWYILGRSLRIKQIWVATVIHKEGKIPKNKTNRLSRIYCFTNWTWNVRTLVTKPLSSRLLSLKPATRSDLCPLKRHISYYPPLSVLQEVPSKISVRISYFPLFELYVQLIVTYSSH